MTETEFDEAFQDLISRPWPSAKEGARFDAAEVNAPKSGAVTGASNMPEGHIYPILPAPRVFPDFGARPVSRVAEFATLLLPHPTSHGMHPGTHPRERSLGVSFLGTEPQSNDNEVRSLGTCATVAREGSLVPWCMDIHTPDEPAAHGFSRTDIDTTAASNRHDIMSVAAQAVDFKRYNFVSPPSA